MDIAKDDFKVCFSVMTEELRVVIKGSGTFDNTDKGFKALLLRAEQKPVSRRDFHFTMEATGVYYEGPAYCPGEASYPVHAVLPGQSKKYSQSLGTVSKTDRIDARMPAQTGLERTLRKREPLPAGFRIPGQLTRERDAPAGNRTVAPNHPHACRHRGKPLQDSVERTEEPVIFLNGQIAGIEKETESAVRQDTALKKRPDCVTGIRGIGLLTAVCTVAETGGFAAVNSIKQLTPHAGPDVKLRESGKWKGKAKISKKGNKYIRKSLYFPTFTKIRHDGPANGKYQRLKERKGIPTVAAVARQRKLSGLIYTLWKKQEMFSPQPEG